MAAIRTVAKLQPADRPKELYEYEVAGRGTFPEDMLRYDNAWPVDGSLAIRDYGVERRTVKLRSYKQPTVDRWSSFGWYVQN